MNMKKVERERDKNIVVLFYCIFFEILPVALPLYLIKYVK